MDVTESIVLHNCFPTQNEKEKYRLRNFCVIFHHVYIFKKFWQLFHSIKQSFSFKSLFLIAITYNGVKSAVKVEMFIFLFNPQ